MIVVGILLEICAAALGTTSKQLIAYSEHVQKRWIFHVGATINIAVGPVVDASAYAFAPQVVIAPFACLDVIFNALTAPYTLSWQEEQLTQRHIVGVALVAMGALCTAVFGSVHDHVLSVYELEAQLMRTESLAYMLVELTAILGVHAGLKARVLSAQARGIALGAIAGVLMGNVFCMKGVIGIVRLTFATGDHAAWWRPTPYILSAAAVGGAVVGHIFMRKGLCEYKGIFMVTIFEGAHISTACLSGCVVMEEMAHAPWWQYLLYWLSVGLIITGMLAINTAAAESQMDKGGRKTPFHIAESLGDEGHREGVREAALSEEALELEGYAMIGDSALLPRVDWSEGSDMFSRAPHPPGNPQECGDVESLRPPGMPQAARLPGLHDDGKTGLLAEDEVHSPLRCGEAI